MFFDSGKEGVTDRLAAMFRSRIPTSWFLSQEIGNQWHFSVSRGYFFYSSLSFPQQYILAPSLFIGITFIEASRSWLLQISFFSEK